VLPEAGLANAANPPDCPDDENAENPADGVGGAGALKPNDDVCPNAGVMFADTPKPVGAPNVGAAANCGASPNEPMVPKAPVLRAGFEGVEKGVANPKLDPSKILDVAVVATFSSTLGLNPLSVGIAGEGIGESLSSAIPDGILNILGPDLAGASGVEPRDKLSSDFSSLEIEGVGDPKVNPNEGLVSTGLFGPFGVGDLMSMFSTSVQDFVGDLAPASVRVFSLDNWENGLMLVSAGGAGFDKLNANFGCSVGLRTEELANVNGAIGFSETGSLGEVDFETSNPAGEDESGNLTDSGRSLVVGAAEAIENDCFAGSGAGLAFPALIVAGILLRVDVGAAKKRKGFFMGPALTVGRTRGAGTGPQTDIVFNLAVIRSTFGVSPFLASVLISVADLCLRIECSLFQISPLCGTHLRKGLEALEIMGVSVSTLSDASNSGRI
jgi:hypothetical protein